MTVGSKSQVVKKTSSCNLVDLAGSERVAKTGASGEGLKEGTNINLSLLYLGQVISMMADPKKGQVVPFRQSKLTSLLKESLGGNSKTALIAALSPAEDNVEETLSTCQFASRAKSIKTSARVNLDEGSRMLAELKAENERIKAEIAAIAKGGGTASASGRIKLAFERDKVDLQKMFKAMDHNKNGEISYEEFTDFVTQSKGDGANMSEFGEVLSIFMTYEEHPFETLDTDGSGTISWQELEDWVEEQANKEVDPEAEVDRLRSLLERRAHTES
jgi:Ca2+-binding EF-hand superfamily protein